MIEQRGDMTYAGLTTADKPALLDAKARGAEWVARDKDDELVGFRLKPQKYVDMELNIDHWERTQAGNYFIVMPSDESLKFIQWSDAEPVNIDLALAQIAEMESKTETNEKCPICEYEISGCQCIYSGSAHPDRNDKRRVVFDHLYLLSPMQLQHVISLEKHWQISYADADLNAILKKLLLNSPYTEGETK